MHLNPILTVYSTVTQPPRPWGSLLLTGRGVDLSVSLLDLPLRSGLCLRPLRRSPGTGTQDCAPRLSY